ncbi:MAG: PadR family transcriptional regulator [Candidatus Micrarchaeota archaeon]|nr:PadR family transcriptional regulator [Candidatus Micrarchaeota archaeon]
MNIHPRIGTAKQRSKKLDNIMVKHRQMVMLLWLIGKESKHGYAIIKDMEEMGFGSFKASRVYPVLSFLCKSGLLSKKKMEMKIYYSITCKGNDMI